MVYVMLAIMGAGLIIVMVAFNAKRYRRTATYIGLFMLVSGWIAHMVYRWSDARARPFQILFLVVTLYAATSIIRTTRWETPGREGR